jgi:hypothetical protein
MKTCLKFCVAPLVAVAMFAGSAHAASLVSYGLNPTSGAVAAPTTATNVTASAVAVTTGGTLQRTSTAAANPIPAFVTMSLASGTWATTEVGAPTTFFNLFTFTSTQQATFDTLSFFLRRPTSQTNDLTLHLYYKIGAGSFVDANVSELLTSTETTFSEVNWDLSNITDFDMVSASTSVQFRMLVTSSAGSDSTSSIEFRNSGAGVLGLSSTVNGVVSLEGTLSAIPEPSSFAVIAGLFACGLVVAARRKKV